ncbi:Cupin superfamily protein [Raoultella terrigena]|uniref:Cupin superfamily protein n=1 Tax=Raoultella terrigena TaxID=577 RepID=A0A3P8JMD1_RAOTE|nr:Cupin superfamily protein [Raoultella terrigena]
MENEVDSRLVSHQDGKWQVSHGPFESYDHLSENNWSLLVQAVNNWHEPTAALMHPFRAPAGLAYRRSDDLLLGARRRRRPASRSVRRVHYSGGPDAAAGAWATRCR